MLSATSDAALMHRFSCMAVRDILELFLARAFRQQGHADSPRRMLGFMSGIVSTYRNRSFPAPEYIMEAMLLLARWDFGLGGPTILIETALAETERRVYHAVIQDDSSLLQTSLKSLCDLRKKRLNVYDKCMAACKECDGILDALDNEKQTIVQREALVSLGIQRQEMRTTLARDDALLEQHCRKWKPEVLVVTVSVSASASVSEEMELRNERERSRRRIGKKSSRAGQVQKQSNSHLTGVGTVQDQVLVTTELPATKRNTRIKGRRVRRRSRQNADKR